MPRTVLVDTGFLVALLDPLDALNAAALAVSRELATGGARMLTTDAIVLELANYFSRSPLRTECARWLDVLRGSPGWEVLPLDRGLLRRGQVRYHSFEDKSWSLTDCISMEVMLERQLDEAATPDEHFVQAGFRILLPRRGRPR